MQGQLEWARVVYPLSKLTWEGVQETARKFKDLEVDSENFYVLYKDEENEQIVIKNEADMTEAANWASENGNLLELFIPYASDNDSDWDVLFMDENRESPRVTPAVMKTPPLDLELDDIHVFPHVDSTELISPAQAEDVKDSMLQADREIRMLQKNEEEEVSSEHVMEEVSSEQEVMEDVSSEQEVMEETEEVEEADSEKVEETEQVMDEAEKVEEAGQVMEDEAEKVEDKKKDTVVEFGIPFEEEEELKKPIDEAEKLNNKRKQDDLSDTILDGFVSRLMTFSSSNDVDFSLDRFQRILAIFSSRDKVGHVCEFLQNDRVQNALVAISNAELNNGGGKTALGKVLVLSKECVELIKEVPEAEDVILDLLFSLRAKKVVARLRHPNVHCDECDASVARANSSEESGYRNSNGEILGDRYKSAVKPDYDLCTLCEATEDFQEARPLLKISDPAKAPELILCALPGATQGMMSQIESLDWRNPIAREFGEFIQQKQQQAFRAPPPRAVATEEAEVPKVATPQQQTPPPPSPVVVTSIAIENVSFPQAKFVADVTLADGSVVRPGELIKKTWRIRNSGEHQWPKGVRIAHVGGDAFGGPLEGVEVPLARAGEAVNVTVPLTMPTQPGRYTSYWRMLTPHPSNSKFGHRFWVTVNVVAPPTAPRALNPPGMVLRAPEAPRRPTPPAPPAFTSVPPVIYDNPVLVGSPVTRVPPPPPPRPSAPVFEEELIISAELVESVAQITEFGFSDIDKIVKILKEVNGDTSRAIDKLLEESQ
jgi:hypothetical protein